MNNNPFNPPGKSYGSTSVADRLDAVARFNRAQLEQALKVPGLQQGVERKVRSRLKKLESHQ